MERLAQILIVFAVLSHTGPRAVAQVLAPAEPAAENILIFWDEDQSCRYQLLHSNDQDSFEVRPAAHVRMALTDVTTKPLFAEVFITDRGASGPARYFLTPTGPIARFETRPPGQGRTNHHVQITCCDNVAPSGDRCRGGRPAHARGEMPDHQNGDSRDGAGPQAGTWSGRDLSATPQPHGPVMNPGGPRMIVIDP
jgi:hypothetical protein